jgi:hypothetical protein
VPFTKLMLAAGALLRVFGLMLTRRVSMVHAHLASGSSFWRKTAFVAIAALFRVPVVLHIHGGKRNGCVLFNAIDASLLGRVLSK